MSLLHEPPGHGQQVNGLQIPNNTSNGKKLKNFLFGRRKSTTLAPPANALHRNSISGSTNSPKFQRKNGQLLSITLPTSGADRPRSQSVYSPTTALHPQLIVQQGKLNAESTEDVQRGRLNSATLPNQDLSTPGLERQHRGNESNALPMSRLLATSNRRDSVGGASRAAQQSQPIHGQQHTYAVGPTEFCEMFRDRTYSDSKNAEAILAAMEARKRKVSDAKSPLAIEISQPTDSDSTFPSIALSAPSDNNYRPRGSSPPSSSNQCVTQTIPENVEIQFNGESSRSNSPSKLAHQRARRVSVFSHQPVVGGAGGGRSLGGELTGNIGLGRRFSEPFPNGLPPEVLARLRPGNATREIAIDSVSKAMANFPKYTATVPPSLISPKDLGIDIPREHRPLVIWKDKKRGTHMFRLPLDEEEWQELTCEDPTIRNAMYYRTMRRHRCYELMPHSSKLVVLDKRLLVISSFYALMFNGIRAAPVWDSELEEFIGMLTVTDFIRVLDQCYTTQNKSIDLEGHTISTWIGIMDKIGYHKDLVTVEPDDSLLEALARLKTCKIHRLLVMDSESDIGSSLFILTHKRILHYIYLLTHDLPKPDYMKQSIGDLNVGTYDKIATISMQTRLIDALRLLITCNVSSLPVLDDQKHVVNIYSRSDAINLVSNESYKNLDNTIEEALRIPRESFEGLYICSKSDSLETIMNWIVRKNVHRMIITDKKRRLVGVVSISDVINYIVLQQAPPISDIMESDNGIDLENNNHIASDIKLYNHALRRTEMDDYTPIGEDNNTNPEIVIEYCEKL